MLKEINKGAKLQLTIEIMGIIIVHIHSLIKQCKSPQKGHSDLSYHIDLWEWKQTQTKLTKMIDTSHSRLNSSILNKYIKKIRLSMQFCSRLVNWPPFIQFVCSFISKLAGHCKGPSSLILDQLYMNEWNFYF